MPLLVIARLTLHETVRRRLVLAVIILTVVIISLTGWGFSRIPTLVQNGRPVPRSLVLDTTSGLVIVVAYMFSFVLAVGAAFLAAPAIAADVESGLVLALLPRPIRRSEFVLGKWLGLATLLAGYAAIGSALELAAVKVTTGYLPPHPILAVAFLVGEAIVLLTLALLCSTRLAPMAGSIIAVVLFGFAWIAGIAEAVGLAFSNAAVTSVGTLVSLLLPTDGLWRGAIFNLEPGVMVAAASAVGGSNGPRVEAFVVTAPPTTPYILWAVAWIVAMLGLAAWSFRRRDL